MARLMIPHENEKGCEKWTSNQFGAQSEEKPFFILVERGGCSFTRKISFAQSFGAQMVLVADFETSSERSSS